MLSLRPTLQSSLMGNSLPWLQQPLMNGHLCSLLIMRCVSKTYRTRPFYTRSCSRQSIRAIQMETYYLHAPLLAATVFIYWNNPSELLQCSQPFMRYFSNACMEARKTCIWILFGVNGRRTCWKGRGNNLNPVLKFRKRYIRLCDRISAPDLSRDAFASKHYENTGLLIND